jgi:hypothetical protein
MADLGAVGGIATARDQKRSLRRSRAGQLARIWVAAITEPDTPFTEPGMPLLPLYGEPVHVGTRRSTDSDRSVIHDCASTTSSASAHRKSSRRRLGAGTAGLGRLGSSSRRIASETHAFLPDSDSAEEEPGRREGLRSRHIRNSRTRPHRKPPPPHALSPPDPTPPSQGVVAAFKEHPLHAGSVVDRLVGGLVEDRFEGAGGGVCRALPLLLDRFGVGVDE